MSDDNQPKYSMCDACRLYTQVEYPDGRIVCNNFACETYVPPIRCEACEDE
jgi:hypothetical protein